MFQFMFKYLFNILIHSIKTDLGMFFLLSTFINIIILCQLAIILQLFWNTKYLILVYGTKGQFWYGLNPLRHVLDRF